MKSDRRNSGGDSERDGPEGSLNSGTLSALSQESLFLERSRKWLPESRQEVQVDLRTTLPIRFQIQSEDTSAKSLRLRVSALAFRPLLMTLLESIANMKLRSLTVGLALLIVTLFLFLSGIAWGPNGHRVVGLIAEQNLADTTRSKVRDLLAGESLAAVSNWADLIRSFDQWSCADPFHYSTIEPNAEYLQQGVPPQGDALGAIAYFFQALRDPAENRTRRAERAPFSCPHHWRSSSTASCGQRL